MEGSEKLSKGLSGIAGEYFVAAELSCRGFMASITLRNNDSIDIHATKLSDKKMLAIQVKTKQQGRSWPLNKKAEDLMADNLYYVFVSLRSLDERPDYFVVPSATVAHRIKSGHCEWLDTPGKKGQPHNDTNMRMFVDIKEEFLERWDFLQ